MNAVELVALASSVSLLAGWRLYLVTLVTGIAMKMGWIALPEQLAALTCYALLFPQLVVAGGVERQLEGLLVVPGVVDAATWGGVGKRVAADQVASTYVGRVEAPLGGDVIY